VSVIILNIVFIEIDDYDKKVLDTTTTLMEALDEYLPVSLKDIFQRLTPSQLQSVVIILLTKVWDRKDQIQSASYYLFSQLLRQTASRVDKSSDTSANRKLKKDSRQSFIDSPSVQVKGSQSEDYEDTLLVDSPRASRARQLLAVSRRSAL
jgi:hypothetical protein